MVSAVSHRFGGSRADPIGHYGRPDAVSLVVNRTKNKVVWEAHEAPRERSVEPAWPEAEAQGGQA